MTSPVASRAYSIAVGTSSSMVPIISPRIPSSSDVVGPNRPYQLGQTWVETTADSAWMLTGLSPTNGIMSAVWSVLGGGSSSLDQLTGDSGTAVPSGGSIKIAGGTGITTAASGSTVTVSADGSSTTGFDVDYLDSITNPILPTGGILNVSADFVTAENSQAPVYTFATETDPHTVFTLVKIAETTASTDVAKIGLAAFDSSSFAIDASGFVTLTGGGEAIDSLIPNSGTNPVVPAANGSVTFQGTGSITTVGGTNSLTPQLTGLTNHAVQIGAGTATLTQLGPTATALQVLQSGGSSADPAFSTATYPATTTVSEILYSSSANVIAGLATANDGVLITSNTGVPSLLANGTTGQVLTATTGSPASWANNANQLVSGTWNPVVLLGATTVTATSGGTYTQTGLAGNGYITASCVCLLTNLNAGSGEFTITGLPVAAVDVGASGTIYIIAGTATTAAYGGLIASVSGSTLRVFQHPLTTSTADLAWDDSNVTTSTHFVINITYRI